MKERIMCSVCETTVVSIHPFEIAGLGVAPFAFDSLIDTGKTTTSCDYCSAGLRYVCYVRSADGNLLRVGMDCIRKLQRDDNRLTTDAEKAMAKLEREKREARRIAKRQAEQERIDRILQEQRDRNGGLTDREVEIRAMEAVIEANQKKWETRNQWLLQVLDGQSGEFVYSMVQALKRGPVSGLSGRCVSILRDIYGKSVGGRFGSKKYDAACEQFYELSGITD